MRRTVSFRFSAAHTSGVIPGNGMDYLQFT